MKTAAVICEYNPFHSGHSYMFNVLKETYGFDKIVCFMSGNFVQRGEPAVLDKMKRTEMALLSGADLVIEIPAVFSTSSAGDFAKCGVSMAIRSGVCSHLCFGVEPGFDLDKLNNFRTSIKNSEQIKEQLKKGLTWPEAVYGTNMKTAPGPNAMLACEYLNAIDEFKLIGSIIPLPIERKGNSYTDEFISEDSYASATSLRKLIKDNDLKKAMEYIPCRLEKEIFCFPDMLSDLLNDRLLREDDYEKYLDVSREISDRLKKQKYFPKTFTQRVEETKTRQYTRSRISRALLHIVLGITKENAENLRIKGYFESFRVLGYRTNTYLIPDIQSRTTIPVYTKNARYYESYPDALYYDQIWHNITGTGTELTRSPIIL